jgi:hypothetical protein
MNSLSLSRGVLGAALCSVAGLASAQTDPLPSWNDGLVKKSIVEFVSRVTTQGGADFVPPEQRIATFDNDGTLWTEKPFYFQGFFAKEQHPYATQRFLDETNRLYGVLDERLEGRDFVCGEYSIADIASFCWMRSWERRGVDISEFPLVKAWIERMLERPAVQRGLAIKPPQEINLATDEEARKVMFGQRSRRGSATGAASSTTSPN